MLMFTTTIKEIGSRDRSLKTVAFGTTDQTSAILNHHSSYYGWKTFLLELMVIIPVSKFSTSE